MINIAPFPLGQGCPPKIHKIRSYVGYNLVMVIMVLKMMTTADNDNNSQ